VVHAPRQSGKTTTLAGLARTLTAEGRYAAVRFSCETAEPAGDDYQAAQRAVLSAITHAAAQDLPVELRPPDPWPDAPAERRLLAGLRAWAVACPLPLVLFFDEIDTLRGEPAQRAAPTARRVHVATRADPAQRGVVRAPGRARLQGGVRRRPFPARHVEPVPHQGSLAADQ